MQIPLTIKTTNVMKSKLLLCSIIACFTFISEAFSQKVMTREGYIRFFGSTPLENVEGVSRQAASILDMESGDIVFQVLVNSFKFEKALMQEHFNENYAESEKYPKAIFKGKVTGDIDYKKPGTYEVVIKGTMTFHGIEKPIEAPAKIEIKADGAVKLDTKFQMVPEDYDIKIPSAVRDKIAPVIEVTAQAIYK
jgi:hypothetical protein